MKYNQSADYDEVPLSVLHLAFLFEFCFARKIYIFLAATVLVD